MFKKNFTTEMSGDKKALEKRFKEINANKKRGIITAVSVMTAAVIVSGAVIINSIATDSTEIYSNNDVSAISATVNPQESMSMVNPYMPEKNPYNDGFVDITGRTIADVAEEEGITLEELLAQYQLPADMRADTNETAAYAMIPLRKMAEIYNMSFEDLKQTVHFPDFVTEDTPWGRALDEVTLGDYVGINYIDDFKDYYGLGDEITAETKWKEVRIPVEEKQKQERWDAMQQSGKVTNALNEADGISDLDESSQKYQGLMD